MKKGILKDILVLVFILLVIYVICRFLPDKIPVHINASGEVDLMVNKYFLLFASFIPYSVYWQFLRDKKKK